MNGHIKAIQCSYIYGMLHYYTIATIIIMQCNACMPFAPCVNAVDFVQEICLCMAHPSSKPITPFYGLLPFHYSCGKKTLLLNSAKLMNSLKKLTTIYREKHDQSEEFDVNHWATIVRYCRCPRATYHAYYCTCVT